MRRRAPLLSAALPAMLLAACATPDKPLAIETYQPSAGANIVLEGDIASAPGFGLKTGDLVLAPGFKIGKHYHHGEEFLYVIGGSVTLTRPGAEDITLKAGDALRIPAGTVHWGVVGADGLRAVSSWVTADGKPLREPVD